MDETFECVECGKGWNSRLSAYMCCAGDDQ